MAAEVVITVSPQGNVSVKAEGWQGPTCTTLTEPFVRALGVPVADRPTAEMFQTPTTSQEVSQ